MATRTKKITDLEVTEETTAKVKETISADGKTVKTIEYPANVKLTEQVIEDNEETETQDNNDLDFNQINGYDNYRQTEEIPKDKIEIFFDDIETALDNENDNFYIKVVRTPDSFDDDFTKRCNDTVSLGLFGCRLNDKFRIAELIQNKNNSGGRFNFIAYDKQQQVLQVFAGYTLERGRRLPQHTPVVARDVYIPNPDKKEEKTGSSDIGNALLEIAKMNQESTRLIVEEIRKNQKPEKSTLETLTEYKTIKDLFDSGDKKESDSTSIVRDVMKDALVLRELGQGFAGMFNNNNAPPETDKTWYEKALENPDVVDMAKNIGMVAIQGFSQMMMMKQQAQMQPPVTQPQVNAPVPQQVTQQVINPDVTVISPVVAEHQITQQSTAEQEQQNNMNIMSDIFTQIVNELESENVINEANPTLVALKAQYPAIYPMIVKQVKNMTLDDCFQTIQSLVDENLLTPFFNPLTNELNERGEKMFERLEILYNFWKVS
jgi:hypothetical protein